MAKIIIICLNPAIDKIIKVDKWIYGSVIRSTNNTTWASGKGVNSARALSKFTDIYIDLVCLVGSKSVEYFNTQFDNTKNHFLHNLGDSRTNVTLATAQGDLIAHIQTNGDSVNPDIYDEVLRLTKSLASTGDIVILSGSLPPGLDPETYLFLIAKLKENGMTVLFDSSGQELLSGIRASPFFIKPNKEEFEFLIGRKLLDTNPAAIARELRALKHLNVEYIAVTLGKDGMILYRNHDGAIFHGYSTFHAKSSSLNEIGSGDSFIAGVAYGLARGSSMLNAVKLGIGLGTANLFAEGPGEIDHHIFADTLSKISLKKMLD